MTILGKRRLQYEEELSHESRNYDVWFDYARLEEDACKGDNNSEDAIKRVREVYERAVAQVPPTRDEKRHWRRYIFLWLNYALFEEMDTKVSSSCFPFVSSSDADTLACWFRTCNEHAKSTELASSWFPTSNSPLRRFGFSLPSSNFDNKSWMQRGRSWVLELECHRRRR